MMEFKEKVSEMLSLWTSEEIAVEWRIDIKGVMTGWCRLQEGALILPAAEAIACLEGRLSMITAYLSDRAKQKGVREISFHFDLDGSTLTLSIELPLEGAQIPSLTPVFRNADWNEREFMELYDIQVVGHPAPRRLFLDKGIDPAAFERLIPYSTFSNGANGKALWEKVMAQNNGNGKETL